MDYAGYIDGAFVVGEGKRFAVQNPSDESVVAEVVGVSERLADAAIRAARRAFDSG